MIYCSLKRLPITLMQNLCTSHFNDSSCITNCKRLQHHSLQFVIFWLDAITICNSCLQLVMVDDIFKWIQLSTITTQTRNWPCSPVAFAKALAKVRRLEVDTHTLRNGTLTEHDFADTINLLLSIGERTVTAINSNVSVSPFPYNVSTHMEVDSQTKLVYCDSKNHSTQVWDAIWSRHQLTSYSSSTPSVYWSRLGRFGALFRESEGFQRLYNKIFQLEIRHVSFVHRLLSIYEWLPDVCILWITLDNNSQRMYKMASLVGQWRSKSSLHRWLFIKLILERNFAAISWNHWHWRQLNRLTR